MDQLGNDQSKNQYYRFRLSKILSVLSVIPRLPHRRHSVYPQFANRRKSPSVSHLPDASRVLNPETAVALLVDTALDCLVPGWI